MKSQDQTGKGYKSEDLLKKARECKGKDFKKLLKEIENAIKKSKENDENLLRAKKVITTRMSSRRTKENEMMESEN